MVGEGEKVKKKNASFLLLHLFCSSLSCFPSSFENDVMCFQVQNDREVREEGERRVGNLQPIRVVM